MSAEEDALRYLMCMMAATSNSGTPAQRRLARLRYYRAQHARKLAAEAKQAPPDFSPEPVDTAEARRALSKRLKDERDAQSD